MDLSERPDGPFRRHPWETVRARHFREVALERVPPRPGLRVLDVGAGDGFVADGLARAYAGDARVVAWDAGYTPERMATLEAPAPGVERVRERPDARFDLILLLDVLEHVSDDASFLRKLVTEALAPRGAAVVSVPAWPRLAIPHDARLGHLRRYSPRTARKLLQTCGLEVVRAGGLFASLLPLRAAAAYRERLRRAAEREPRATGPELTWRGGDASARLAEACLGADAWLCGAASRARVEIPGLSWWASCRRAC